MTRISKKGFANVSEHTEKRSEAQKDDERDSTAVRGAVVNVRGKQREQHHRSRDG